jgi:4-amino-4-deoxy-L-arabinose transferase-like glycosyltransferase
MEHCWGAPCGQFAWASWVRPGTYPRLQGSPSQTDWALQDIHALSHEIAEWADDPFVNNLVQPWLTPTAPQYGCTNILETGDPVVAIGFAKGTDTFETRRRTRSQSRPRTRRPTSAATHSWAI